MNQDQNLPLPNAIRLESAEYVPPYRLRLRFSDGHESLVDFEPFLSQSRPPAAPAQPERKLFRKFTVEGDFLRWDDVDLEFPLADLYAGEISQ